MKLGNGKVFHVNTANVVGYFLLKFFAVSFGQTLAVASSLFLDLAIKKSEVFRFFSFVI